MKPFLLTVNWSSITLLNEYYVYTFFYLLQLLRDASGGCLEIHHGDVLEFDVEKACEPYVEETKQWEDGVSV